MSLGELMAEGGLTELVKTNTLQAVWGWNHSALALWPGDLGATLLLLLNLKFFI